MIIGQRKPLESIEELLAGRRRVLVLGCGGCTSICLAGGQREAQELAADLHGRAQTAGRDLTLFCDTIERQCNADFFDDFEGLLADADAVLSLACGAGVQFVAERCPDLPVLPALDTICVGVDRDVGWYEENCRTCGDCVLGETAAICPVTRCAKSLFNGPCGGTRADGHCEVDARIPCAWFAIYDRLQRQGRLDVLAKVQPARQWRNQTPRTVIQDAYRPRYEKKGA